MLPLPEADNKIYPKLDFGNFYLFFIYFLFKFVNLNKKIIRGATDLFLAIILIKQLKCIYM